MELVWIVAGGIGPVLGGAFTEKLSWRCKLQFPPTEPESLSSLNRPQGTSG